MSSSRPRVAFVDHVAQISGGEIALLRLIEALGARAEVHVILGEDGPLAPELERHGATVHLLPMNPSLRDTRKETMRPGAFRLAGLSEAAAYVRRLRRLLVDIGPDVVHTNSLKSALVGGVAAKSVRLPVLWHVRDRISPDYLPTPAVWMVRALSRVVPDQILVNSRATAATVPAASTVVYDAVPAAPPHHHRTEEGPVILGMVGRLAPWKGQDVFVRALALARRDHDLRARLIGSAMFGEDAYEASLHDLCAELGIADIVDFRGFCSDIWAELAEIDVLVHASVTPEPFGQVVIEGMAAGVAVIAADAGGPAEVVTPGHDGLLVAPGDVAGLAAAIGKLAGDPGLRAQLAAEGRRTSAEYDPQTVATAVLAAYEKLRGRPGLAARLKQRSRQAIDSKAVP
ncbi:MAG: glycosyltransferase [Tetrasphaera sp.]